MSRAHSVLVGAAVRMAECMGLNRDGSKAYNLNPLETHVRRLIWHQLCFLDIRTCEAQGPKPAIRRDDYDTWLPDNLEEDQLTSGACPARPCEGWTSNLLPLIRFEVNEMMRIIWADRRKLESRRTTLTQVLFKIEKFRKRMLDNYDRLLDERVPIQRYAKLVMHLLMYRLHVMILHPYYANTANPMPQRLRSVLIMSAMVIIELAMQLDTNPDFRLWRWYGGAYQQYQAALILATEMFYHPSHKDASRIWACLDYVFALECTMPTEEKGRQVLAEIMGKMGVYMSMRKMRAPTATASASPAKQAVKTEENDDGGIGGDDEEDDDAMMAAAAVLARAGMETTAAAAPTTTTTTDARPMPSPLFEQPPSGGVAYRAPLMMKQEPGTVPSMSSGPLSSSSIGSYPPTPSSTMQTPNLSHHHSSRQGPQQQQQQQQPQHQPPLPPGSAPMLSPPSPLSWRREGGGTSTPHLMMAAMMTPTGVTQATTTAGSSNNGMLWSLPPMSGPPFLSHTTTTTNNNNNNSNSNAESPGDSSLGSDGGSIDHAPGPSRYHHCQVGGDDGGGDATITTTTTTTTTTSSMAPDGSGGSTGNGSSSHLLDSGDWVRLSKNKHNFPLSTSPNLPSPLLP